MDRQHFLKTCATGICGCGMLGLLGEAPLPAQEINQEPKPESDPKTLQKTLAGARGRFALLLSLLAQELEEPIRQNILKQLGKACSESFRPFFEPYAGKPEAFLEKAKAMWVDQADYHSGSRSFILRGKPSPCLCPLVQTGKTPTLFCTCSQGWYEAVFSAVFQQDVSVEIIESVLRGGSRCSFRITLDRVKS